MLGSVKIGPTASRLESRIQVFCSEKSGTLQTMPGMVPKTLFGHHWILFATIGYANSMSSAPAQPSEPPSKRVVLVMFFFSLFTNGDP
jgi:hypothetical protein